MLTFLVNLWLPSKKLSLFLRKLHVQDWYFLQEEEQQDLHIATHSRLKCSTNLDSTNFSLLTDFLLHKNYLSGQLVGFVRLRLFQLFSEVFQGSLPSFQML